jgi:hypothetical protein
VRDAERQMHAGSAQVVVRLFGGGWKKHSKELAELVQLMAARGYEFQLESALGGICTFRKGD